MAGALMTALGGLVPVRIRRGPAAGLWWTLYPHSAYWRQGGAEPEIQKIILQLGGAAGQVSWDLGSHFGLYAVALGRSVGPTGQVVAVEPDPFSFSRLRRHIRLNRLEKIVHPINAGASDRSGVEVMHLSQGFGATTSHFYYPDEPRSAADRTTEASVVALGELVAAGTIRPPSFIKVDVEGHGAKALAGCRSVLAESAPVILMGFHGGAEVRGTTEVLSGIGYRPHKVSGEPIGWPQGEFIGDLLLRRE